jgi:hypothetical protein
MVARRLVLLLSIPLFLAFGIVSLFYFLNADFYVNSNLFWVGAVAGFLGPLVLTSLGLLLFSVLAKNGPPKGIVALFSMVVVLALSVVLIYRGPLDSDVWWYGAIAGFLSSLSLTLFMLAIFVGYRLTKSS